MALLIYLKSGTPIVIAHRRVGFGGRTYKCLKFRTMVVDADKVLERYIASNPAVARELQETCKLRNDPRILPIGRLLRKTSLDELPQLVNVLRGEMSCVGPRPVEPRDIVKFGHRDRNYMRALPGLTGLWQVNGRSTTTLRRRIAFDTLYVRNWSIWLDIKILLMTIPAVLRTGETS